MQRDYLAEAAARRDLCKAIALKARHQGLNIEWEAVNRQLPIWKRWYNGQLATGYLIRQTGVKPIPR